MSENKKILHNFIYNIILTVSTVIFPLITYPYISRIIGPTGTGKVNFAYSVLTYFLMFAQLGIPTYGIKTTAQVRDDKDEFSKVVLEIFIINMVLTFIVYVAFIISLIFVEKFRQEKTLFILMSSMILLNTMGAKWLYKGIEEYKLITIRSIFFKIICIVCIFVFIKDADDYLPYGILHILANFGFNIINFFDLKKYIKPIRFKQLNFKRHYRMIVSFFAISASATIYGNSANVFLGFMKDSAQVGIYDVSIKIKNVLMGLVTSLSTVLLPRMSYYWQKRNLDDFKKFAQISISFVYFVSVPLAIFFIIYAKQSILIISDKSFIEAYKAMLFVMPSIIFMGMSDVLGVQIMIPSGNENKVLYSQIIASIVNVISSVILINKWGFVGAAISLLLTEFTVFIVQSHYINDIVDGSLKMIINYKQIIANILACLTCIFLRNYFTSNFISLMIGAINYFLVYIAVLYLLHENTLIELIKIIKENVFSSK